MMDTSAENTPSSQVTIWIDRPVGLIWNMVASIERLGRYSPETVRTEWLAGSERHEVGARFRGFNRNGTAEWHTDCEITDYQPLEVFGFSVDAEHGQYATIWRYKFDAERGGTQLTESFESPLLATPPPGMNPQRHQVMEGMLEKTLAAIKADADAS